MSQSIQEFLAAGTLKASADLITAYLRIPADKREWSPSETSRSAVDQLAECALLNGFTDATIKTHVMTGGNMDEYFRIKAQTVKLSFDELKEKLATNTAGVAESIKTLPERDLSIVIDMPWGPMTLEQMITYPMWNMNYHEAQINYIASILGSLK